jgi:Raf kinase inhibitor-like YbhB/YbcL family protein
VQLTSPAFDTNQPIPAMHTSKGEGVSPQLVIAGVPAGAQSLALIVHDPDAPSGDFTHWVAWNISATTTLLPEGRVPEGTLQGVNDFGTIGYGAPSPPSGTHRYIFELYALDTPLPLQTGASRTSLESAMNGHIVAQAQLMGTVSA